MQEQHYVHFLSPGSFLHEETIKPISSWDVPIACEMAKTIQERHSATPFCFYFETRIGPDSKRERTSPRYYLGGEVETYMEIFLRDDPKEGILRHNMSNIAYSRKLVNFKNFC